MDSAINVFVVNTPWIAITAATPVNVPTKVLGSDVDYDVNYATRMNRGEDRREDVCLPDNSFNGCVKDRIQ